MNKFVHFFIFMSGIFMILIFFFQFEGGMSHLPLLDPSMRAIPLSPAEWKERLEAVNKTDLRAKDYHDRNFILLDVRNGISSKVPK